jgi:hypothetical protein
MLKCVVVDCSEMWVLIDSHISEQINNMLSDDGC